MLESLTSFAILALGLPVRRRGLRRLCVIVIPSKPKEFNAVRNFKRERNAFLVW